jgi:hypothetical protein
MKKSDPTQFNYFKLKLSAENIKFYGTEPEWRPGTITPENRAGEIMKGLNWLNYVTDVKEQRKFIEDWIRLNRADSYKRDLALWNRAADKHIRASYCNLARLQLLGIALTENEHQRIWESVVQAAEKSKGETSLLVAATGETKIGVQERMDNQVNEVVGEVESYISDLLRGKIKAGDVANPFGSAKLSAIHYKKLAKALEPVLKEYMELDTVRGAKKLKPMDEQLVEGYAWVKSRALKQTLDFLVNCAATANRMASEAKVVKARKKKPVDKAKLVKNFKFQTLLDNPKVASIQPVACLSSTEVWVYNTKTRKLGVYKGEFDNSIMIKGNKFVNVMKTTSVQKTLRKPEVQLAEFQALAKNQIRKWFDKIKGVEHRLNGRGGETVVLLKAI